MLAVAVAAALLAAAAANPASASAASSASSAAAAPPEVDTTAGRLRGRFAPFPFAADAEVFRGIPFAQPPVGPLRFAPPQPLPQPAWNGTREATRFSPDCYTHNTGMSGSPAGISEDCLYLNVYRPRGCSSTDKLPVVVYFYGGGWGLGSGSFPVYNGAAIIGDGHQKVVIATVNYRLDSLGWLGGQQLRKLSKTGGMGNQGLLDQRLATQWVRANAEAFCGDGSSITVWGESAGAASISDHLVMPGSRDMFERAIMDSGPMATWIADPEDQAEAQFELCAESVGCGKSKTADQLDCIQKVSAHDIVRCSARPAGVNQSRFTPWAPIVDGVEIPDLPWKMAAEGKMKPNTPVLLGSNLNEGTLLLGPAHINLPHDITVAQLEAFAHQQFDRYGIADEVIALYPASDYESPWWAGIQVLTDLAMACPARRTARWAALVKSPAYLYEFEHEVDVAKLDPYLGVFHGDDLVFTWILRWWYLSWKEDEDVPIPLPLSPDERDLQDTVSGWWMNFARTGNPNSGSSAAHWPATNATHQPRMDITLSPKAIADWRPKYCDFWDKHPEVR